MEEDSGAALGGGCDGVTSLGGEGMAISGLSWLEEDSGAALDGGCHGVTSLGEGMATVAPDGFGKN